MDRGGDSDDCLSTPEAEEMATKLSIEKKNALPKQGEVDFINGGPPCQVLSLILYLHLRFGEDNSLVSYCAKHLAGVQGFSGMNRFNYSSWSKMQCEMILGFLSYAEYFRPRYFLLENVRNFVSFNKGQTFRLTVATLLEMGYQVFQSTRFFVQPNTSPSSD